MGHAKNLQGILINLDVEKIDGYLKQLKNIQIPKQVMANGLIFIWAMKNTIPRIIELMTEKNFTYVENIVFSFFDPIKVAQLMHSTLEKSGVKKQKLESFFKVKKDSVEDPNISYDSLVKFFMNNVFDLPKGESVPDYFLSMNTDLISSNKRTLLIFRRVT
jgi:hypothetical protein